MYGGLPTGPRSGLQHLYRIRSYDSYYELVHSMKKYYCANIILDYWYGYELVDITRYLDLPPVYFLGAMAWLT